jgi:hypothetical protein
MSKESFQQIEKLVIIARKNLFIRKWDQAHVEIRYPVKDKIDIRNTNTKLEILSKLDCMISAPEDTVFVLENVAGDCKISGAFKNVVIENIGGNLEIENVSLGSIEKVGGDLLLGSVSDSLRIERVGGDLILLNNSGKLTCEKVGGDFYANGISGGMDCVVGGNITMVNTSFLGTATTLKAGGDIKVAYIGTPSFRLQAKSGGGYHIELGKDVIKGIYRTLEHAFGSGGPSVFLKAGGSIKINAKSPEIRPEVHFLATDDESWDQLEKEVEERQGLNMDLDDFELDNLTHQINNEVQMKTKLIEARIQKTLDKLDKKFEVDLDDFTNLGDQFKRNAPNNPVPKPTRGVVSEEEKMMILKMLQDKKITAEEADNLLNTLAQS